MTRRRRAIPEMPDVMGERSRVTFRSRDGKLHTVMVLHVHDSPAVPAWCKPLSSLLINLGMAGVTTPRFSSLISSAGTPGAMLTAEPAMEDEPFLWQVLVYPGSRRTRLRARNIEAAELFAWHAEAVNYADQLLAANAPSQL